LYLARPPEPRRPRQTGVNAITIVEGDHLLEARLTDGNSEILLAVRSGRAIRFEEEKVRPTGRGAIGVAGIEVDDETDEVIGMICVNREDKSRTVLVVSEKGYGKRTPIDEYRITNRGGKGIRATDISKRDEIGALIATFPVGNEDQIMLVSDGGQVIRVPVNGIRIASRATKGVTIFNTAEGEKVVSVERISEPQGEEGDESAAADAPAGK